jgi:hypothetical protein
MTRRVHILGVAGGIGVFTASRSSWASRSPPAPSGRSSRTPASTAPDRTSQTWATFLGCHADAMAAADFFEAVTLM